MVPGAEPHCVYTLLIVNMYLDVVFLDTPKNTPNFMGLALSVICWLPEGTYFLVARASSGLETATLVFS